MRTFTPHDYQHLAIAHMKLKPICGVWAGLGMGKTVSTLTALRLYPLSRHFDGQLTKMYTLTRHFGVG